MRFLCWDRYEGSEDEARQIEADDGYEAAVAYAKREDERSGEVVQRREVCVRYQGGRLETYETWVELEPRYSASKALR